MAPPHDQMLPGFGDGGEARGTSGSPGVAHPGAARTGAAGTGAPRTGVARTGVSRAGAAGAGKARSAVRMARAGAVPVSEPGETVVYTDGSCLGNPGPGGWAWAVVDGPFASGAEKSTTNQRMEITAVLRGLQALAGPVLVVSDSTYVVNCFRDRWWEGWRRRGWRNASGQPVANRDLWEPLLDLALDDGRPVRFAWVRGHSGDAMNERVDLLATEAAATQRGAGGSRWPGEGVAP